MKVERDKMDPLRRMPVGELQPGTAVVNSEGNLCMVIKDGNLDYSKVRIVGVESGNNYTVNRTCEYEVVDALVTWKRRAI